MDEKQNPTRLSRRIFLRITGSTALGMALSACHVTATQTETPISAGGSLHTPKATLQNKLISTNTVEPTGTTSPSATPKPAYYAIFDVLLDNRR